MPDIQVFLLASTYGRDRGLSDHEIGRLAEHLQSELEDELHWIVKQREAAHAIQTTVSSESRKLWASKL
jgi:hypothetical protein